MELKILHLQGAALGRKLECIYDVWPGEELKRNIDLVNARGEHVALVFTGKIIQDSELNFWFIYRFRDGSVNCYRLKSSCEVARLVKATCDFLEQIRAEISQIAGIDNYIKPDYIRGLGLLTHSELRLSVKQYQNGSCPSLLLPNSLDEDTLAWYLK